MCVISSLILEVPGLTQPTTNDNPAFNSRTLTHFKSHTKPNQRKDKILKQNKRYQEKEILKVNGWLFKAKKRKGNEFKAEADSIKEQKENSCCKWV